MASNKSLALPYLLPFFLYTGVASLPDEWLSREWNYALRIVLVGAALAWAWPRYASLGGPRSRAVSLAAGAGAGVVGLVLWILLARLFLEPAGAPWSDTAFWLRVCAATTLVPVFEELVMRGYVLRFAVQWGEARKAGAEDAFGDALDQSILAVAPGAATVFAVCVSTIAFTLGHHPPEMVAAAVYGLLMCGLWIWRQDLVSCIAAHAVTNAGLAYYVRANDAWGLW